MEEFTHNEIAMAHKIHNLNGVIEDLRAQLVLKESHIWRLRAEVQTLKSLIGHQHIELQNKKNTIDTDYEETN